ncbi:glycerol-3-phosphate dehydrogenase [Mobiluncus mulieris]|uniref:Glycerol-3-phosphate dehydrogenase n=1 Tax=Mobiluncus mulieris TaxID=2052 RepID=A0A8G2M503_9ACTO|nr:glycerol-3-phosphate dehydrogenase/oxidase [Mobiluncus mulieris]MBB5845500.1 glycerol-3-phosphate dehydrogenase [Mobiluncus mulieris]STO15830.1 Aerobic glycerol-3-phosphate dehydrogenase [Mobiluncus mulieris]
MMRDTDFEADTAAAPVPAACASAYASAYTSAYTSAFDPTALNATRRQTEWWELNQNPHVDLLVIGGGITGAGIALDAATRGLSVALVERRDLAFGTSRWSSKLVHGGLRYLAKLQVGIAFNSARERRIIMERTAPHLVRPLAQVTPLNNYVNPLQILATRAGYRAGDLLAIAAGTSRRTLPHTRFARPDETRRLVPTARRDGLKGAWVNYDGQMIDDARLTLAVARTAAGEGARILTYCEATEATGNGAWLTDTLTEEKLYLHAKAVINATGVWAASLDDSIKIRPSRGTHLVFDAAVFGHPKGALTIPLPGSVSRYLFVLPADKGRCYLGLTDEDQPGPIPEVPSTPEADIDFLLENINRALSRPVTRADIRGVFTGLRPLLAMDGTASTADLSRRHATVLADNGLVSIVGGKFTEYRLMAEQAVDAVVNLRGLPAGPCRTRNFPLVGAPGYRRGASTGDSPGLGVFGAGSAGHAHMPGSGKSRVGAILLGILGLHEAQSRETTDWRIAPHESGRTLGRRIAVPKFLWRRFGNEAVNVVKSAVLERPLDRIAGLALVRAEIEYAITHEGALSVEDILERRTRLTMIPAQAEAARGEVTEIFTALETRVPEVPVAIQGSARPPVAV